MLSVEYQAELALLLEEMEGQPKDEFELYEKIHEKLNEMRAFGLDVPEDLAKLETYLKQQIGLDGDTRS